MKDWKSLLSETDAPWDKLEEVFHKEQWNTERKAARSHRSEMEDDKSKLNDAKEEEEKARKASEKAREEVRDARENVEKLVKKADALAEKEEKARKNLKEVEKWFQEQLKCHQASGSHYFNALHAAKIADDHSSFNDAVARCVESCQGKNTKRFCDPTRERFRL